MTTAIQVRDLTVAYSERPVLSDVDIDFEAGVRTAIVGPNGAGKSTLIKAFLGLIPVVSGTVQILDRPIAEGRKRVAYVPQRSAVDWDFPTDALDVVSMGTYGRLGLFRRPGQAERQLALACLERVGMADFARRQIGQLSGGQQQRVFIARALAQQAQVYVLDEPFAGVDATTEIAIVDVLKELRDAGKTIVAVHHDLETASAYFDQAVVLNVRLIAAGSVEYALAPEQLKRAYGPRAAAIAGQ